jgi:hypothetical protein
MTSREQSKNLVFGIARFVCGALHSVYSSRVLEIVLTLPMLGFIVKHACFVA